MYIYIYIEKKNATFCILLQKNTTSLCILLRSLQKNVAFSAFFYVLKKITQKNASFFGSHMSPKTRKRT